MPGGFDLGVGGHDLEDLGCRQGMFGVHVAPPEDRFDPAAEPHATMIPEQLPHRRVRDPFDLVVHRRQGPVKVGIGVGEQHPLAK